MKCKYEIVDDFLPMQWFVKLQKLFLRNSRQNTYNPDPNEHELTWQYCPDIINYDDSPRTEDEKLQGWQLVHVFCLANQFSPWYHHLKPLISAINPIAIWRIKANLSVQQKTITEGGMHIDGNGKLKYTNMMTSVYYVNSNDGYTKLEDGTKIESIENRLVTFNTNVQHTGSTCTDSKVRVVINLNYFKDVNL